MKAVFLVLATAGLVGFCLAAEKRVKLEQLPPAIQQAARQQLQGLTLVAVTRELEHGKVQYELETKVNGHTKDILLDETGAVAVVEEEVGLQSVPDPVRTAITKRAAGARILRLESITPGGVGAPAAYEARVKGRTGIQEFQVRPDGTLVK